MGTSMSMTNMTKVIAYNLVKQGFLVSIWFSPLSCVNGGLRYIRTANTSPAVVAEIPSFEWNISVTSNFL